MSALLTALSRIFYKPQYVSDTSQFIDALKLAKPSLEAEQRAGRALLWDKNVDRTQVADNADSRVAQKPYVYR
jgi:Protein of unknown function (DUF3460)